MGIAASNGMTPCIHSNSLATYLDGVGAACTAAPPSAHVSENGKFAVHTTFSFDGDTLLEGYLQSYKYFDPKLRETLRFKSNTAAEAEAALEPFHQSRTKVGIHVRRGDIAAKKDAYFIRLPPTQYFRNVLAYFRSNYADVQFIVASDDPTWCSKQPFFLADDVRVVTEKHTPAVDMAILAGCDHMVMTVGTFGWWAAYLGADAKGGEVVYYDSEFKMDHPNNNGNVVLADYYPERWVAMGAVSQLIQVSLFQDDRPFHLRIAAQQGFADWFQRSTAEQRIGTIIRTVLLASSRNATFVDVGMNRGYFTLLAARLGFRVVGVEATTSCVEQSKENLQLNRLNATVVNAAVARVNGGMIRGDGRCNGANTIMQGVSAGKVPLVSLESVVSPRSRSRDCIYGDGRRGRRNQRAAWVRRSRVPETSRRKFCGGGRLTPLANG